MIFIRKWSFKINPEETHTGIHDFSKDSHIQRTLEKVNSLGIGISESSLYRMKRGQSRYWNVEFLNGDKAILTITCIS